MSFWAGGITKSSYTVDSAGIGSPLNAPETTWSTSRCCSISRSNSVKLIHQLASLDYFREVSNLRSAWLVITGLTHVDDVAEVDRLTVYKS